MKSNQKFSQSKQTSLEGLQSVALKQQDLPLTSTAHSQESTVSEETGQKPTKTPEIPPLGINTKNPERYKFVDGEWWYYYPKDGTSILTGEHIRERVSVRQNREKRAMYVDGKRISKNHPLYKPGRYKGFTDAAFSSLQNYQEAKQGQVYVIRNPAFPSWCKVGMAVDAEDRLKQYQTASPYRDYVLVAAWDVEDRREAEKQAHALLEQHYDRRGEWFVAYSDMAAERLEGLFNKDSDNE